jgi:hypothetical protein
MPGRQFQYYFLFVAILAVALCSASGSWARFEFEVPQKYSDVSLSRPLRNASRFADNEVVSRDFVRIKKAEWSACHQKQDEIESFAIGDSQSLSRFLESNKIVRSLQQIEEMDLLQSNAQTQPWSGDYWAYSRGILGARHFDPRFMDLSDWLARFNFIGNNSTQTLLKQGGQAAVELLSPSEKYDLIIGDESSALTSAMWAEGKRYYDSSGEVENWMGICHGWAAAAMMEPRPKQSIDLTSFDQHWRISLNPSEIKGLVSYNWATNNYASVLMGDRCNKKNPKRDENGRIIDPECFDLNPAVWHLAVVNQMGIQKRSLIMDASYDYEVWNQPLNSYSYTYFNVLTKEPAIDLEEATIRREDYTNDPYKRYRGPQTKFIVGISMIVGYVVETNANQQETDSEQDDQIRYVNYEYELELDNVGNVIGGEWYQTAHPDFIWTPLKQAHPRSQMDSNLQYREWNGTGVVPTKWANAAKLAAPYGIVLDSLTTVINYKSATE